MFSMSVVPSIGHQVNDKLQKLGYVGNDVTDLVEREAGRKLRSIRDKAIMVLFPDSDVPDLDMVVQQVGKATDHYVAVVGLRATGRSGSTETQLAILRIWE